MDMKKLRKIKITMVMLLLAVFVYAQDNETRDLRSFTEISVAEGIEVIAEKGTKNSVEIISRRIDLDRVLTEVRGGELSIHIDNKWYKSTPRHDVKIKLTYTDELERIKVNTGAELVVKGEIKGKRLDINTSTSGIVELKVAVEFLDMSATTSGRIEVEGVAEEVEAGASTGGTIYAYDVTSKDVSAKASTGADIRVNAEDYLKGKASTGGSVYYKGRPRTSMSSSTGGSVRSAN